MVICELASKEIFQTFVGLDSLSAVGNIIEIFLVSFFALSSFRDLLLEWDFIHFFLFIGWKEIQKVII